MAGSIDKSKAGTTPHLRHPADSAIRRPYVKAHKPEWLRKKIRLAAEAEAAAQLDADNKKRIKQRLRSRNVCWKKAGGE